MRYENNLQYVLGVDGCVFVESRALLKFHFLTMYILRYGLMVPYSNQNHRHRDRIVRIQGVAVAII